MKFVLAILLFFSTVFDACLVEAISHDVDEASHSSVLNAAGAEASHYAQSNHSEDTNCHSDSDLCQACQACHGWVPSASIIYLDRPIVGQQDQYALFFQNPFLQKLKRPPRQV